MQTFTGSVLHTIQQHSEWAWLIVFLIAFIESLAIFGLFMPGWFLLVGIGTMIGADILEFFPIVVSAYLGAVIGEYLSYYVGYHYHEIILRWKFVARHERLIEQSKDFFKKHGAAGVFFGRFVGPVRAIIPLVAGISEMPKRTFFWVNLTSGLIWAPLYLIPGILIGAAVNLEKEVSTSLIFVLLLISLVLWMAVNQTKKSFHIIRGELDINRQLLAINFVLVWGVFAVLILILIKSSYYDVLKDIFAVVWSKIF
jgi:membrane protein DedA with SNARE-associated domain